MPLRRAAGFIPRTGHGQTEMAALLLQRGAGIDARINWNDTPAAVAPGTPAVAEVMLAHGAPLDTGSKIVDRHSVTAERSEG